MTDEARTASGDFWKWVSAVLIAIMLAGLPAVVQAVRAPTKEDVAEIQEGQVEILVRITALESKLMDVERRLNELEQRP